ncbi:hypothetical protein C0Q70_01738 [Pomacea canaliculata]|uniref:Uncharacterized protein n=1 Tax=Pomacea canaliculata TaxID=400727 RepID=A0A2T7Q0D6_POMCA|nr:hypothetical protein C0Q70_01738 [Pomacea canaliculata]
MTDILQPTAHQAASCLSASATPSSTLVPPSTCNTRLRISDGGTSCSGVQMALRARRLNGAQSRDIRVAGLPKEGDGAELTPTLVPARPSRFLVLDRRASHRKWCFRFHSLHHRRTPDGPDNRVNFSKHPSLTVEHVFDRLCEMQQCKPKNRGKTQVTTVTMIEPQTVQRALETTKSDPDEPHLARSQARAGLGAGGQRGEEDA